MRDFDSKDSIHTTIDQRPGAAGFMVAVKSSVQTAARTPRTVMNMPHRELKWSYIGSSLGSLWRRMLRDDNEMFCGYSKKKTLFVPTLFFFALIIIKSP